MYDTTHIPSKHQPVTTSSDDFGQYGSLFASDSEREIPQQDELYDQPTATATEITHSSNAARLQ